MSQRKQAIPKPHAMEFIPKKIKSTPYLEAYGIGHPLTATHPIKHFSITIKPVKIDITIPININKIKRFICLS